MTSPYAHPDYLALLAAVIAQPDDDAPRLVLADWLDEHGDPARGEFVRVQCELSRLHARKATLCRRRNGCLGRKMPEFSAGNAACRSCRAIEPARAELARREGELSAAGYQGWRRPFGDRVTICLGLYRAATKRPEVPADVDAVVYEFRRGFVEELRLSAADWLEHADDLTAATPLRKVELTTAPGVTSMAEDFDPSTPPSEWLATPAPQATWGLVAGEISYPKFVPLDVVLSAAVNMPRQVAGMLLREFWPGIEFVLPPAGGILVPPDTAAQLLQHATNLGMTPRQAASLTPAMLTHLASRSTA